MKGQTERRPLGLWRLPAVLLALTLIGCDGTNDTRTVEPAKGGDTGQDDDTPVSSDTYTLTLDVSGLPDAATVPISINGELSTTLGNGSTPLTVRASDTLTLGKPNLPATTIGVMECAFPSPASNGKLSSGTLTLTLAQAGTQIVSCDTLHLLRSTYSVPSLFNQTAAWMRVHAGANQGNWLQDAENTVVLAGDTSTLYQQDYANVSGGRMVFSARSDAHGDELWVSDGTPQGTSLLVDLVAGTDSGSPTSFVATSDGKVYFYATSRNGTYQLFETDGTTSGTRLVELEGKETVAYGINKVALNDKLVFTSNDRGLYIKDGDDITLLGTFTSATTGSFSSPLFYPLGERIIFILGKSGTNSLWVTDGTVAGTRQLDVPVRYMGSTVNAAVANGVLYFNGYTEAAGLEPWRSDGTEAGTYMLADIVAGDMPNLSGRLSSASNATVSALGQYAAATDGVYFTATDIANGGQLWKATQAADSGRETTSLVKTIIYVPATAQTNPGPGKPTDLIGVNNRVLFYASATNDVKQDLWISDGTETGTVRLAADGSTLWTDTYNRKNLLSLGSRKIWFLNETIPDTSITRHRYWITDATIAGTMTLTDTSGTALQHQY